MKRHRPSNKLGQSEPVASVLGQQKELHVNAIAIRAVNREPLVSMERSGA